MSEGSKIEEFKSWRLVKVLYWLLACLLLVYALTQSAIGAFVISVLAYPVYVVVRRTYMYIQGIKHPKKKLPIAALKEVAIVLFLLLGALLIASFIASQST